MYVLELFKCKKENGKNVAITHALYPTPACTKIAYTMRRVNMIYNSIYVRSIYVLCDDRTNYSIRKIRKQNTFRLPYVP